MTLVDGLLMILALMGWVGVATWQATAKRSFLQSWLVWSALSTGATIYLMWRVVGSLEAMLWMLVLGPTLAFFHMLRYGGWTQLSEELRARRDR